MLNLVAVEFKIISLILVAIIMVPQTAYAAWWNPLSWVWLDKILNRASEEKQEQVLEIATSTEEDKFEVLSKKIE